MGSTDDPATKLVREHFPFVWRVLRRLGQSTSDADDTAQRVMIIGAGRLADMVPGRERAFLFRIAWFLAAREKRDRHRRGERFDVAEDEIADEGADPEALLARREARERLDLILRGMPRDLRMAFVLFEIEGLTKLEVADALGVPVGTAASRRRRAREAFKRQMQRLEPEQCRKEATP